MWRSWIAAFCGTRLRPRILLDPINQLVDSFGMRQGHAPFDLTQWLDEAALVAFHQAARIHKLPPRALIYQQSDDGDEMFRLVSGSVRLSVMGADGRELLYRIFEPGDCFGTSSLVDGETRPQTAEAFEAVELQVFDRASMARLRADHPYINDALLRLLSRHMRLLSDYFAAATLDEVALRLAQRLIAAADAFGTPTNAGIALSTRLSQSDLASMTGTARQTVNRILQMFQDQGLITIEAGAITIIAMESLQNAAQQGSKLRGFAF